MASSLIPYVACAVIAAALTGCASPFDQPQNSALPTANAMPGGADALPRSAYRQGTGPGEKTLVTLSPDASPDDYIRYALLRSPEVEAAYQRWRAAAERLPQVRALPDPRVTFGFFLDEVETRTGAQNARIGLQQAFPSPGKLRDREDAASRAAAAGWYRFEAARLSVAEQVISVLHDLAYLDTATMITEDNLGLLRSFEEMVRARYRVGTGSHPELIRVQVELGQIEDRLAQLRAMRPAYAAELNALLNRASGAGVPVLNRLPGRVAGVDAESLVEIARRSNPALLALDEQIEEQRILTGLARKEGGVSDLTVGLEYIFTNEAMNPSIPESGDDPIMLTFGASVPLWRDKYDAAVRESIARRLSVASDRAGQANLVAASIHRAWFEHTDADRRVRLYEQTLIPKAEESLRASLGGFRVGDTSFLDLLDTERTLLEFTVAAEGARAGRGKALARLNTLVGEVVPTVPAAEYKKPVESEEMQP